MKKIMQKVIIWLFEKYAFDYWVDVQNNEEKEKAKQRYGVETDKELDEVMIDMRNQPFREAYDGGYDEGVEDGINKVLDGSYRL